MKESSFSTDFPLYCVVCFGGSHFIVAGGGGAVKTGIPNAIEAFEIMSLDKHRCDFEGLNRSLTDNLVQMDDFNEAVMNGTVSKWGLKQRSVYFATGMNNRCTVFEIFKEPNKEAKFLQSVEVCPSSKGYQTAVVWSFDNKHIITADSSGAVSTWKFPQMERVSTVAAHKSEVEWIASSLKSNIVVTCGRDGTMKEINFEHGKVENELFWTCDENQIKNYRCRACCFGFVDHQASQLKLFSVHIPKVLKNKNKAHVFLVKWDSRLIPERKAVLAASDTPSCLAVSHDGNFLAIGSLEGHVQIYISFSLKCVKRIENVHTSFVTGLAFAPVTFSDESAGSVMQSRVFCDFDAVLLSISIDKQVQCITIPKRSTLPVGIALLLCLFVICLTGLAITGLGALL